MEHFFKGFLLLWAVHNEMNTSKKQQWHNSRILWYWCKNKIVSRVRELGVVYEINAIVEFLNSACDEFCLASQKSSGNY
jgi:hypothetical protein